VTAPPVAAQNWVPGNYDTAAALNALGSAVNFSLGPPEFAGYQNIVQSIPSSTWTALLLDTEREDTAGGHSTVTNTSRYVVQYDGTYICNGVFAPAINATGFRAARLQKNGSPILGGAAYLPNASGSVEMGIVTPTTSIQCVTGDYIEVAGYQSSGGALNTVLDADLRTALWVRFSHV
jgi:hypothetical protein